VTVVWLIAMVIFIILEAATVSLVSTWFIFGSLVAMLISVFGGSLAWQIFAFLGVSIISLTIFLIWIKPKLNQRVRATEKTNADRIIEKEGIVLQTIDPINNTGLIKVKGQNWSATSYNDQLIEKDTLVIVKEIKGVKAIVMPKDKINQEF